MTKCNYPLCYSAALYIPVVELPTIRVNPDGNDTRTDKPTYLLFPEVCPTHRRTYNLMDWFGSPSDWSYIQEVGRSRGYRVPDAKVLVIHFHPLGWTPPHSLEVLRGKDEADYKK